MTLKQLYNYCSDKLSFSDCGDFESLCIFNDLFGISKGKILLSDICATEEQEKLVKDVINRRINGEPLQYILGKWDFYDLTFAVGEGVLIPRPETEMLVDFALEKLKGVKNPIIYDLCAGTGCVGLTIASHLKDATVYLLEKEDMAFSYLKKNKELLKLDNAILMHGDLFSYDFSSLPNCDLLLSNPPYINTNEIQTLQKEVLKEPITALDGGIDGLDFYRCIAERCVHKINKNGFCAFECGEQQSEEIIAIFNGNFSQKEVLFDFNNIDRIVTFRI